MNDNKKYIVILILILITILLVGRSGFTKNYQFNKVEEYIYEQKKPSSVLKDCRKIYDNRYKSDNSQDHILSLVKIVELSDYLLYKSEINSSVYYDLMKSILVENKRQALKNKDIYTTELEQYISKKKITGIEYLQFEISEPIFYEKDNQQLAYALVMKKINDNEEYKKYNFIKENDHWYYTNDIDIKKITKVLGKNHD